MDLDRLVICATKGEELKALTKQLADLDKYINKYDLTILPFTNRSKVVPPITVDVDPVRTTLTHQIRDIEHYLRSYGIEIPENDYALVRT